jgi:RHS repeat-associated protein
VKRLTLGLVPVQVTRGGSLKAVSRHRGDAQRGVWVVAVVIVSALSMVVSAVGTAGVAAAESVQARPPGVGQVSEVPLITSPDPQRAPAEMPLGTTGGEDLPARFGASTSSAAQEVVEERTSNRRVYRSAGGITEVELSTAPLTYEVAPGDRRLIDTAVVADGPAPADGYRSAANSWTAHFERIDGAAGGLSIDTQVGTVGLVPRAAAAVDPSAIADSANRVRYPEVWADVDVEYTVQATGVKEDIVIQSDAAASRFEFDIQGAAATADAGGGLRLSGAAGDFIVPPPLVADASGNDATQPSGVRLEVLDGGAAVAMMIDEGWLADLPESAFPLRLDPTIEPVVSTVYAQSWPSNGGPAISGIRLGTEAGGVNWRTQIGFDYAPYINHPSRLVGAALTLSRPAGAPGPTGVQVWAPTAQSYAGTRGFPYWEPYWCNGACSIEAGDTTGTGFTLSSPPSTCDRCNIYIKQNVQSWFDAGVTDAKIGVLQYSGTPGRIADYTATLRLYLQQPPPAATLTSPADNSTIATRTPTITAAPVAFQDAFPVRYRFDVRSGDQDVTVSSGWTEQTSWTVPEGSLRDGATYTAEVRTASAYMLGNDLPGELSPTASVRRFRIDMGLGDGGPAPTTTAGAVTGVTGSPSEGAPSPSTPGTSFTINMIDGNLAASVPTHSVTATAGAIAPTLVYNSRADSQDGLDAAYYSDDDRDQVFDATDTLRTRRRDPTVSFSWSDIDEMVGSMPEGADALVRWTGFIRVPQSGSWSLGLDVAGFPTGGRVFLADETTPAVDDWAGVPVLSFREPKYSDARQFTAGTPVPIKVEFWGHAIGGIKLLAQQGGTSIEVPQSWLSAGSAPLPQGWQLTAGAAGTVDVIGVQDLGDTVLVQRADGSAAAFRRQSTGGYSPPPGDNGHLAVNGQGQLTLSTANSLLYRFRSDGQIDQVTSVADDRRPAALAYTYGGSPVRLSAITDPVSGRQVTFTYGGGGCVAPAGLLCRISFWDGAVVDLTYDNQARLVRVTTPGYQMPSGQMRPTQFDFGYDAAGRLTRVRDPLAADLIALTGGTDDDTLRTVFGYDSLGRLTTITSPRADPGVASPTTTYTYAPDAERTTTVQISGFSTASGFARRVRWNPEGRIVEDTDAAGLTTSYQWDAPGHIVATTAPGNLRTTHAYDTQGNKTDTWGPAPAARFGSDNRPLAGAVVPQASTAYDEGFGGLAATFWSNPDLAGAATGHGSGQLLTNTWAGGPPVTPDAQGRWSMRLTGEISLPTGGTAALIPVSSFFIPAASSGWTRLWIDDRLVFDSHVQPTMGAADGSGWHRIRVDFVHATPSDVLGVRLGTPESSRDLRLDELRPAFGLPTRATDADGKVITSEYADPTRRIGPEHGLVTATVADPAGLALRTTTRYEDPTTANTFLRRTDRVLPAGGTTTTVYYQAGEAPPANTCGITDTASQRGFAKQVTQADPDGTGPKAPLVAQFVYDTSGRVVGTRRGDSGTIGSAGWACTTYDGRGRVVVQLYPAHGTGAPARARVTAYAADGNPLATRTGDYGSPASVVGSVMDLRGHLISYETALGTTTRYYDSLGRPILTAGNGALSGVAYDAATGRAASTTVTDGGLFGTPPANHTLTATHNYDGPTGRLASVSYSNGTHVDFTVDELGRPAAVVAATATTNIDADLVARSLAGRITEEITVNAAGNAFVDANPAGPNYAYDPAGRLTESWDNQIRTTYNYGTATCGEATTGKNTNLVSSTRGTTTTSYCYDRADRVIPGGAVTAATYDDHGNTLTLGSQTYLYDAADRHTGIRAGTTTVDYVRDPLDRIVERREGSTVQKYVYDGFGDTPVAVTNASGQITERYASLPGGVAVTFPNGPGAEKWSYPDLHGNVVAITDGAGVRQAGPRTYDPWGRGTTPDTTAGNRDLGAFGTTADRYTEHAANVDPLVDMGARPYNVTLGRFLTRDPIEGGCANDYVYVAGDPMNQQDLTGTYCLTGKVNGHCRSLGQALSNAAGCAGRVLADITSPFPDSGSRGDGAVAFGAIATGLGRATIAYAAEYAVGAAVSGTGVGLVVVGAVLVGIGIGVSIRDNC